MNTRRWVRLISSSYLSTLASRSAGTGIQFVAQILVSRVLGSSAVGALGVVQSWMLLIGTAGTAGSPAFVLRRTAADAAGQAPKDHASWLTFGWMTACAAAPVALLTAGLCWWLMPSLMGSALNFPLIVAIAVGSLSYSIARVGLEEMKGSGKVSRSLLYEFGMPFLGAALFVPVCLLLPHEQRPYLVPFGFVIAFLAIAVLFSIRVVRSLHALDLQTFGAKIKRSAPELGSLLGVQLCNQVTAVVPILIVGTLGSLSDAGAYTIISRLVGLSATISATLSAYFSRSVFDAARNGDGITLRKLYFCSTLSNGGACALILIPLCIAPRLALWPFGAGFLADATVSALVMMAVLRFARQFFGLSELFLTAIGKSHYDLASQLAAVGTMIGVFAIVGNAHIMTAALATGVATLVRGTLSGFTMMIFSKRMAA